jgi:N-acetylneuraminate lyase
MIEGRLELTGLYPATYTPLNKDGSLNLALIPPMVTYLAERGVSGLYVCGSTGEGMSLSTEERKAVAETFVDAARDRLTTIVQVGHNSLAEAKHLAAHAHQIGADAVSATAPSYYSLTDVTLLVECMEEIASVVPTLPFYYYDIPSMTGVDVDMVEFLRSGAERIPNLVGLKYTSLDIPEFQACLELEERRFEVLWGTDEMLLSAMVVGGRAAIGSTYNIAAPLYNRLREAFGKGDLEEARRCQSHSMSLVRQISKYPFHPAMKCIMKMNGIDCGPCRRPLGPLSIQQAESLRRDLERIEYFEWSLP